MSKRSYTDISSDEEIEGGYKIPKITDPLADAEEAWENRRQQNELSDESNYVQYPDLWQSITVKIPEYTRSNYYMTEMRTKALNLNIAIWYQHYFKKNTHPRFDTMVPKKAHTELIRIPKKHMSNQTDNSFSTYMKDYYYSLLPLEKSELDWAVVESNYKIKQQLKFPTLQPTYIYLCTRVPRGSCESHVLNFNENNPIVRKWNYIGSIVDLSEYTDTVDFEVLNTEWETVYIRDHTEVYKKHSMMRKESDSTKVILIHYVSDWNAKTKRGIITKTCHLSIVKNPKNKSKAQLFDAIRNAHVPIIFAGCELSIYRVQRISLKEDYHLAYADSTLPKLGQEIKQSYCENELLLRRHDYRPVKLERLQPYLYVVYDIETIEAPCIYTSRLKHFCYCISAVIYLDKPDTTYPTPKFQDKEHEIKTYCTENFAQNYDDFNFEQNEKNLFSAFLADIRDIYIREREESQCAEKIRIIGYNADGFDHHFLRRYSQTINTNKSCSGTYRKRAQLISKNEVVIQLYYGRKVTLVFMDLLKYLPEITSLKAACCNWELPLPKIDFDIVAFNKAVVAKDPASLKCPIGDIYKFVKGGTIEVLCKKKRLKTVISELKDFVLADENHFDMVKTMIIYCERDVVATDQLLARVRHTFTNIYHKMIKKHQLEEFVCAKTLNESHDKDDGTLIMDKKNTYEDTLDLFHFISYAHASFNLFKANCMKNRIPRLQFQGRWAWMPGFINQTLFGGQVDYTLIGEYYGNLKAFDIRSSYPHSMRGRFPNTNLPILINLKQEIIDWAQAQIDVAIIERDKHFAAKTLHSHYHVFKHLEAIGIFLCQTKLPPIEQACSMSPLATQITEGEAKKNCYYYVEQLRPLNTMQIAILIYHGWKVKIIKDVHNILFNAPTQFEGNMYELLSSSDEDDLVGDEIMIGRKRKLTREQEFTEEKGRKKIVKKEKKPIKLKKKQKKRKKKIEMQVDEPNANPLWLGEYIDWFNSVKAEASNEGDENLKKIAKLFMNCIPGKFTPRPINKHRRIDYSFDEDDYQETLSLVTTDDTLNTHNYIGTFIVGAAKYVMMRFAYNANLKEIYDQVPFHERVGCIYTDTDSGLIDLDKVLPEVVSSIKIDTELGTWNDDLREYDTTWSQKEAANGCFVLSPKSYCLFNKSIKNGVERWEPVCLKQKGTPMAVVEKYFTIDDGRALNIDIIRQVLKEGKLTMKFEGLNKYLNKEKSVLNKEFENKVLTKSCSIVKLNCTTETVKHFIPAIQKSEYTWYTHPACQFKECNICLEWRTKFHTQLNASYNAKTH
jgi:hypothetical protein